ncbi:MAG: GNAT family N-acetyltransferase [Lautropia sp.]
MPTTQAGAATAVRQLTISGLGPLTVRPLDESDQPAVRALFARTAQELSESVVRAIPALASGAGTRRRGASWGIFGPAASGGRLLAIGGLRPEDDDDGAGFGLVVAPQFRGLGLGTAMVRTLLDDAPRHGTRTMKARIAPTNCAMLALARHAGLERQRLFGDEPILLHASLRCEDRRDAPWQADAAPAERPAPARAPRVASDAAA